MPTKDGKKEVKTDHIRDGAISVTIWHNMSAKGFPFDSFSFQRSYRDDSGQWKNTDSFRRSDLLRLARLCEKAYDSAKQGEVDENG